MEFLGRELVIQSKNCKIHLGIQAQRHGPRIQFLMFANDCIIFAKASQKACSNIDKILHNFCAMFGQLVNFISLRFNFRTIFKGL